MRTSGFSSAVHPIRAAGILLAAILLCACRTAGERCQVREVQYNGWKCVELTNGRVDVVVAPELGGRIIQLRLSGFEYLWANPGLAGQVKPPAGEKAAPPEGAAKEGPELLRWANYGGDKLWPAPQGWSGPEEWPGPPDPVDRGGRTDSGPFQVYVLNSGPSEAAVLLVGPEDLYAGIRFEREIRLKLRTTTVELRSTMVNITEKTVRWGIWQVTQHDARAKAIQPLPGGDPLAPDLLAWAPLNPGSRYPNGYRVMFGPEKNPQFASVELPGAPPGEKVFQLDYAHKVGKVGLDSARGWLAVTHEKSGHLFAHTFPTELDRPHPDGATVELWASGPGRIEVGGKWVDLGDREPWLVETEVLSPFAELRPRERYDFGTQIHLARAAGPIYSVTREAAALSPLEWSGKGLKGRIALFHDGFLELQTLSAKEVLPVRVAEVRAGEVLDLGGIPWLERIRGSALEAPGSVLELQLVSPEGERMGRIAMGETFR